MRRVLLLFCIIFSFFSSVGAKNEIGLIFTKEIMRFIDSVKHESGNKLNYKVFYVKILNKNSNNDVCFSISYIMNYDDLKYIAYDNYIVVGSDFVLVNNGDFADKEVKNKHLKKIDSACSAFLEWKLFSQEGGFITSHPQGGTVCINDTCVWRKFYEYADDMPPQFSVFNIPEGAIIEKIYEPKVKDKGR